MVSRRIILLLLVLLLPALPSVAQSSEQLQVGPPPLHRAEPPSPGATREELEKQGDQLRVDKNFLDALDFYEAAAKKGPITAGLYNKMGICQLMMQRYKEAKKSFERAIKTDRQYVDAYNNLGVAFYELGVVRRSSGDFKRAIKQYDKAIAYGRESAAYYKNRGAAYFAKKEYEKATADYAAALQLDPDIFETRSSGGVQAMLPSPEERARYEYVLAKLYAKTGDTDRSLHYLKKAMEDGYKGIGDVYKDNEFAQLRKDPRFAELMAAKPPAIPE